MSKITFSRDRVHSLLATCRRRYFLYCLYLYANPMPLLDVAGQIAEWEHGEPEDELLDERMDVYISLYHNHVPKLVDADVVAYDRSEDVVERDRNADKLRPYLERVVATDLETHEISAL